MILLKAFDFFGREITLTLERFEHISEAHPIVEGKIEEIEKTIQEPEIVIESKLDSKVMLYYKKTKEGFLTIVIKTLNGKGFIVTAYVSAKIKAGTIIWKK